MSESIIRKWKKLYCEEVIEAFEGEDMQIFEMSSET